MKQTLQRENLRDGAIVAALVALGVAMRWIEINPNTTGVGAIALFGGFLIGRRSVALLVPILTLAVSNLLLPRSDSLGVTVSVYACLLLPALMGGGLRRKLTAPRVGLGAVVPSLLFFLVTNFFVWACGEMYDHNLAGLALCYEMALPFLGYMLLGDLPMALMLFGGYVLLSESDFWPGDRRLIPVRVRKQ